MSESPQSRVNHSDAERVGFAAAAVGTAIAVIADFAERAVGENLLTNTAIGGGCLLVGAGTILMLLDEHRRKNKK